MEKRFIELYGGFMLWCKFYGDIDTEEGLTEFKI